MPVSHVLVHEKKLTAQSTVASLDRASKGRETRPIPKSTRLDTDGETWMFVFAVFDCCFFSVWRILIRKRSLDGEVAAIW
jgi:hypothetical protein